MLSYRHIPSRRILLVAAGLTLLSVSTLGHLPESEDAAASVDPPAPGGGPGTAAIPASAQQPSERATPRAPAGPATPIRDPAKRRPVYELSPERKVVALTIDDGPDPRYTPTVLSLLRKYGIRATFFIVGENAQAHPELVRAIAEEGHHVANHTWSHPDLRQLSEARVREELEHTSEVLHRATGRAPTWFRAPGGDFSQASLTTSAELGMRPMAWSVDPRDWSRPGTSLITSRVLDAVRPGSIVLNHDGGGDRSQTIAALQTYLPVLIDGGYFFTAPA